MHSKIQSEFAIPSVKKSFSSINHLGMCKDTGHEYSDNGRYHRLDGPAFIRIDPDTNVVTSELWCVNGQPHRTDGPAFIERDRVTGELTDTAWYIDGKQVATPVVAAAPASPSYP